MLESQLVSKTGMQDSPCFQLMENAADLEILYLTYSSHGLHVVGVKK